MAADELASFLLRLTLLASAAVIAAAALRVPLRKLAGPRVAFGVWLLVPLVMAAAFAPPPPSGWSLFPQRVIEASPTFVVAPAAPAEQTLALPQQPVASTAPEQQPLDLNTLWVSLWAAGLAGFTVRLIWLQARFSRRLGRLSPDPVLNGVYHSPKPDAGPAVVGLLRSRIVLPSGFPTTYEPEEQALIIAHERTHLRDRHPLISAFALVLLAVQWFNPLAHLALRLFRVDQELACDAAVIAAHPDQRAVYARAMLKAGGQGATEGPLAVS